MTPWFVYVLWSRTRRRTYVGTTVDLVRRLDQHNGVAPGGARNTRAGRPWKIAVAHGPFPDRSTAQRIEREVKRARGRSRLTFLPAP